MTQALMRAIAAAGGELSFGAEVASIEVEHGRVTGVRLRSDERIAAGAMGAWAGPLGESVGAPLPLVPRRRHLAQLVVKPRMDASAPVVWCLGDELYLRPESGGVLASPCDEAPWRAELPAPSPQAIELLAQKLGRLTPRLSDAAVRRSWAGLRTFAPDGAPTIGADPRLKGLFWLAGLGGHGMTGGLAAGELLAAAVTGREHALLEALSPRRLVG